MGWIGAIALVASLSVLQVPFVAQDKESCGAAALAMVMRYHGALASHDRIAAELHESELHGIRGSRLAEWAQEAGFFALAYEGDIEHLRAFLEKGRPLIVALGADESLHDVVVVGFDPEAVEVIVHDPALGPERRIAGEEFERRWRVSGHWTLLVLPQAVAGTGS